MADIFLSYAQEDLNFAEKLAKALETQGWSVWWDRSLAAGDHFSEVIAGELKAARCSVTVWSRQSVGSRWVRDEADSALEQNKLVPVRADDVAIPLGFRGVHTADLRGWRSSQHPGFRRLVRDISERLGPAPQPQPQPQELGPKPSATGWFQRAALWLRETVLVTDAGIPPIIQGIANRSKVWVGGSTKRKMTVAASVGVLVVLVYFGFSELREEHATPAIAQSTNVDGILAQVTRCERNKGILSINLQVVNDTQEKKSITLIGFLSPPRYDEYYVFAEGKKYLMLRGPDNVPMATPVQQAGLYVSLEAGRAYTFWAKYTAPPPEVKNITYYTPITTPFEDVPITEFR